MSPAAKLFQVLVGEEHQKNWVLWASYFNYWIQGRDPLLATVTKLDIIDPAFPGNSLHDRIWSGPNFENYIS